MNDRGRAGVPPGFRQRMGRSLAGRARHAGEPTGRRSGRSKQRRDRVGPTRDCVSRGLGTGERSRSLVRRHPARNVVFVGALVVLGAGCRGSKGDPAAAPRRSAVPVQVAPAAVQDVVYPIKALGSLEAEELIQVTAEVEGAVSEVLFHEGDRVSAGDRAPAHRPRALPPRGGAGARRPGAGDRRRRARQGRLDRREALAQNELVAAEELNRARAETAQLNADAEVSKAADGIALQNVARSEVRPPAPASSIPAAWTPGSTSRWGRPRHAGGHQPAAAALQGVRGESLRARRGNDVTLPRGFARGRVTSAARIYHVGEVADRATRQVEVLAWVKNPGDLKPGFFAEVKLASETHQDALVVPEAAIQASEQRVRRLRGGGRQGKAAAGQDRAADGDGVVEILSGLKAGETVVTEGSDRAGRRRAACRREVARGRRPRSRRGPEPVRAPRETRPAPSRRRTPGRSPRA